MYPGVVPLGQIIFLALSFVYLFEEPAYLFL